MKIIIGFIAYNLELPIIQPIFVQANNTNVMKFLEFIVAVEKYRALVTGNGHKIAKMANVEYQQYSNAMNGRLRNSKMLKSIYDSIVSFCEVNTEAA